MILTTFMRNLQSLRDTTELLECLDWDEELLESFTNELHAMLMAAPPNLEKALFWLKSAPWECFDGNLMPDNVFKTIKILMIRTQVQMRAEEEARNRHDSFVTHDDSRGGDDEDWN